jgi:hypothetical protein
MGYCTSQMNGRALESGCVLERAVGPQRRFCFSRFYFQESNYVWVLVCHHRHQLRVCQSVQGVCCIWYISEAYIPPLAIEEILEYGELYWTLCRELGSNLISLWILLELSTTGDGHIHTLFRFTSRFIRTYNNRTDINVKLCAETSCTRTSLFFFFFWAWCER